MKEWFGTLARLVVGGLWLVRHRPDVRGRRQRHAGVFIDDRPQPDPGTAVNAVLQAIK